MIRNKLGKPVSQRQLRVGEMIKQSLGMIFLRNEAKVPNLETNTITVTEVKMSQDLKIAKAFVLPLGGKNADEAINILKEFSFLIRKVLSKKITINNKEVWAQRLSYVGELGWELYIKMNEAKEIYNLIVDEGKEFNLSHCGMFAMDTMRMEKGYLHWGHDMSPEENQYEAGLSFTISYKKNVDFIGKEALLKIKDQKPKKKLVILSLKENKPGFPLLLHDEPILSDGKIIGRTNI